LHYWSRLHETESPWGRNSNAFPFFVLSVRATSVILAGSSRIGFGTDSGVSGDVGKKRKNDKKGVKAFCHRSHHHHYYHHPLKFFHETPSPKCHYAGKGDRENGSTKQNRSLKHLNIVAPASSILNGGSAHFRITSTRTQQVNLLLKRAPNVD
jgi:hypothetical protein